jgi:hypothetical protein
VSKQQVHDFADDRHLPEKLAANLLSLLRHMGCSRGVVALAFGDVEGLQRSYAVDHLGNVLAYDGEPLPPGDPETELARGTLLELSWPHLTVVATAVREPQAAGQGLYALTELPYRWRRYATVLKRAFAPDA